MQRAVIFQKFLNEIHKRKHSLWNRISANGSESTRLVLDPYTGEMRQMIYFGSNDYLNLTNHPDVIRAGNEALIKYGAGAGSVPLLGGTLAIHRELEQKIARFKGCEDAIIYTSGFGSNAGTLLAMLNKKDVAVVDTLIHASLADGCMNTNIKPFIHSKMSSLENVLKKVRESYRTKLVVVDGVYSMDGDIAPLDEIIEIAHTYDAFVMVDDAHATGVIGENGRGTAEHFHIEGKVDIVAGTFSKAIGVIGGFIASNKELVNLLRYYSRSFVFSTALTPQAAGSIIESVNIIEREPQLRENLWNNIRYLRKNLIDMGYNIGNAQTAIFPIILGDDYKVREACRILHENDIFVNPVQFPAVSRKLSRIRISIMQSHTKEQLDILLNNLEYLSNRLGLIEKNRRSEKHENARSF